MPLVAPRARAIVVQCPSLSITKIADAGTVSAGSPIGYTITVTNAGPGTARNVTLSDTLPTAPGVSWSVESGSLGCAITGNVLTCLPRGSPGRSVHHGPCHEPDHRGQLHDPQQHGDLHGDECRHWLRERVHRRPVPIALHYQDRRCRNGERREPDRLHHQGDQRRSRHCPRCHPQ